MEKKNSTQRTIGFHPCVGTKASGEDRPTSVVIRTANGKHEVHEFGEQQLLDFFTCGAVVKWRDATVEELNIERPPHHLMWVESDKKAYDAYEYSKTGSGAFNREEERDLLFRLKRKKSTEEINGYFRAQVPAEHRVIDPATDTVGVANGGLGYQIMDILLGRYPLMDMRVIGSGTLKERRADFDLLLPKAVQKKAEQMRLAAEDKTPKSGVFDAPDGMDEMTNEELDEFVSKSKAKDANAKFDAHRIAYALADDAMSKLFHACTLRDRDWAGANIAYGHLERARKDRVAAEQQFRQIHRTELRKLVKDIRVPHVTLGVVGVDEETQKIEGLQASYERTLRICITSVKVVDKKLEVLRGAFARIEGARVGEEEMEKNLEHALNALPEYTEFLAHAKDAVHPEAGLPLGKYLGPRIFGRWIAGFGTPMASRLDEPMRQSDIDRIAACRKALTDAINAFDQRGLPPKPESGGGKTREWLLACERIVGNAIADSQNEKENIYDLQLTQIHACRDAYRALTNARKSAANRPLNRVIAFMGLHVRHGGKYEGTPKDREFPRRRKGGRANWNENMLRQGAYQWASTILRGGDSYWKVHVFDTHKARLLEGGMKKGHAHKQAQWRMTTVMVRWLISEWFDWERARTQSNSPAVQAA